MLFDELAGSVGAMTDTPLSDIALTTLDGRTTTLADWPMVQRWSSTSRRNVA